VAPRRFEVEPAKIAALLPETFIAECAGMLGYRFRLAGTKICEQFGRELRGADLLSLWNTDDRDAVASLLRNVFTDAAVGHFVFRAYSRTNRQASFELVLLPLIHTGEAINRVLGAITAIEPPFWLGAEPCRARRSSRCTCIGPTAPRRLRHAAAPRRSASPAGASVSSRGALPGAANSQRQKGRLLIIIVLGRKLRRSLTEARLAWTRLRFV
jgi:hypothetical protein